MSTDHPWQLFPGDLIRYALDHLNRSSEFDQIVGFLLLDVGVETLFKVFLTLPEEVTKTNMSYTKRKQAAEGNFHELVKGVKDAAKTAGDRLKGINLGHVEYFHGLRNKLYHAGNGITVQGEHAEQYASIAMELLDRLLGVDLKSSWQEQLRKQKELDELKEQVDHVQASLRKQMYALEQDLRLAIEQVEPAFVMPSFEHQIRSRSMKEKVASIIMRRDEKMDERLSSELCQLMPEPFQRFVDKHDIGASMVVELSAAAISGPVEFLLTVADITFELPADSPAGVYSLARIEGPPQGEGESETDYWMRMLSSSNDLADEMQEIHNALKSASGLGQTR